MSDDKEELVQEIIRGLKVWWDGGPANVIRGEVEEMEAIDAEDEKHKKFIEDQLKHLAENTDDEIEEVVNQIVEDYKYNN